MKNEIDVVRDISAKFAEGRISYMLTGSMAMDLHNLWEECLHE